jgi:hypothetical protein
MQSTAPLLKTRRGAFAEARCGDLLISASARAFDDAEWREHCDNMRTLNNLSTPCYSAIILAIVAGPNSAQRQILAEEYRDVTIRRMALLTESIVARGGLTAIGWLLSVKVKAYAPREHGKALDWLRQEATFDTSEAMARIGEIFRVLGADPQFLSR